MANPPPANIFTIALSPLKGFLVDLPPGATRGMRREKDGWDEVVAEIVNNQAAYGDLAGITASDFKKFTDLNDQYDQIAAQLPVLEKAEEVLTESEAYVDDLRHKLATQIADAVELHSKGEGGDPTLLTAYEKTLAYRAVSADKAVKTRKKNEEAKKAKAAAAAGTSGTTTTAATTGASATPAAAAATPAAAAGTTGTGTTGGTGAAH